MSKSTLSTRWAQMSKQEQIIEKKKIEIQAKLEAQKQAAALAAQAKLQNPTQIDDEKGSVNIFSNDGSFMSQFKALLEQQKEKEKVESEKKDDDDGEDDNNSDDNQRHRDYDNRKKHERPAKDNRYNRRSDRNRKRTQSPMTPVVNEKPTGNIPSLMKIPIKPPSDHSPENEDNGWDENPPFNMSSAPGPGPMCPSGMGNNGPMMPPGMGLPGMGPMGPRGMMGPPPNGPMPPFMGRPPFPPNMPPFMCGPNGPMPPFFGPFPGGPMMRPPPNRHMPPFMGPPFGGPNLPNAPFMPPNADSKPDGGGDNKNQNIPHPHIRPHVSKEDNMNMRNESANNEVFSTDGMPPAVRRVAEDVAMRGDHWEAQVKAQHPNMW